MHTGFCSAEQVLRCSSIQDPTTALVTEPLVQQHWLRTAVHNTESTAHTPVTSATKFCTVCGKSYQKAPKHHVAPRCICRRDTAKKHKP
jgi:hypothetical protein